MSARCFFTAGVVLNSARPLRTQALACGASRARPKSAARGSRSRSKSSTRRAACASVISCSRLRRCPPRSSACSARAASSSRRARVLSLRACRAAGVALCTVVWAACELKTVWPSSSLLYLQAIIAAHVAATQCAFFIKVQQRSAHQDPASRSPRIERDGRTWDLAMAGHVRALHASTPLLRERTARNGRG